MLAVQVQYWTLQENKRHNKVVEDQGQQTINESVRHNVQSENIGWGQLGELTRHNKVSEALMHEQNRIASQNAVTNWMSMVNTGKLQKSQSALNYASAGLTHAKTGYQQLENATYMEKFKSEQGVRSSQSWQNMTGGVKNLTGGMRDITGGVKDLVNSATDIVGVLPGFGSVIGKVAKSRR